MQLCTDAVATEHSLHEAQRMSNSLLDAQTLPHQYCINYDTVPELVVDHAILMQVLHVLGHCVCDAPSRSVHLPLYSYGVPEHCGGQWHGHAHAAVLHPAGWLCHC